MARAGGALRATRGYPVSKLPAALGEMCMVLHVMGKMHTRSPLPLRVAAPACGLPRGAQGARVAEAARDYNSVGDALNKTRNAPERGSDVGCDDLRVVAHLPEIVVCDERLSARLKSINRLVHHLPSTRRCRCSSQRTCADCRQKF